MKRRGRGFLRPIGTLGHTVRVCTPFSPASRITPLGGQLLDDLQDLVELDRLHEVVVEPRGAGAGAIVLLTVTRDRDDTQGVAAADLADLAGELEPVHHREPEIEETDVERALP